MTRWLVRAAAVLVITVLTACSDDPAGPPSVDRVEVGPADQVVVVGDSTEITAVALTSDGDIVAEPVLWRTLNPTVATLRVSGGTAVVRAQAPGTARIEAEAGGRTGHVYVTVEAAAQVATVELQPTTLVLQLGQQTAIQAVAKTAAGQVVAGRAVTWVLVSGNAVAVTPQVGGLALLTAQQAGDAVLRATIDGIAADAEIEVVSVTPPPQGVASVTIAPSGFALPINHETTLQAIAKDASGAVIGGVTATWSLTVDSVGTITPIGESTFASFLALKAGTTLVRATIGGVTADATVQVTASPPPAQPQILFLYFTATERGAYVNQVVAFTEYLQVRGANGPIANPVLAWAVEDSTIASIDAQGNVRGLRAGRTKVRVSAGNLQAISYLTVFDAPSNPAVYDLTFDWWDAQWHMSPAVGTEKWTDGNGVEHDVTLYVTSGSLALADDGTYERRLIAEGWISTVNGGQRVIQRELIDQGTSSIIVGGETGYYMKSTTTPGYEYRVVAWREAGHVRMRAAIGTAPEHDYLFRQRP
ncbi:MAG TPA: Ig-like domain-containing protein [Longimicrobiales bacterium]